jgi:anti-sigma factor RsiW
MSVRNDENLEPDIARDATYHRASDALRARVQASIKDSAREHRAPAMRRGFLLAAAFAAVAVVSWNVAVLQVRPSPDEAIAREVLNAHVRSLMGPSRLNDVASSDQHTVKPWFIGKLAFAPPVRDLAGVDFPLAGGRLDFLDGRQVAALTYKRRLHTVNLFVWPASEARDSPPQALSMKGYSIIHWTRAGMRYWAISDLGPTELATFAEALASTQ